MIQAQFNAYDEQQFRLQFQDTDLGRAVSNDFDELIYDRHCRVHCEITPRQQLGEPACMPRRFFMSAFYYLGWLIEKNPIEIYDLGCGWNIFKRYLPQVIGVAAESQQGPHFYGDIHDFVDDDYVTGHNAAFHSVYSICALHFIPMRELRSRVLDFASMIAPGGRGWLSLNAQRLCERDPNWSDASAQEIDYHVRSELADLPFEILVFDVDLERLDNPINGNMHLVIQQPC